LWRGINDSIIFARFFSIFCISGTIYAVSKVAGRFFRGIHPGWIAVVIAFHPLTIYSAVEIRLYALAILLSALLFLFFYDGYLSDSRRNPQFAYILVAILSLYTQYYLGFLLLANGVVLSGLRRWKSLRDYSIGMGIVGLCFAPFLPSLAYQLSSHANINIKAIQDTGILQGVYFILGRISEYITPWRGSDFPEVLGNIRSLIFRSACFLGVFIIIKKRRVLFNSPSVAVLIIEAIVVVSLVLVRNITSLEFMLYYHTAVLFLPTFLTVFLILSLVKQRKTVVLTVAVMLLLSFCVLVGNYAPLAKFGDSAKAASHIMALEKPGEPIFFVRSDGILMFSIYYSGCNELVRFPEILIPGTWTFARENIFGKDS
jgi:hypothetical protein